MHAGHAQFLAQRSSLPCDSDTATDDKIQNAGRAEAIADPPLSGLVTLRVEDHSLARLTFPPPDGITAIVDNALQQFYKLMRVLWRIYDREKTSVTAIAIQEGSRWTADYNAYLL
jgi:hypothetical protein